MPLPTTRTLLLASTALTTLALAGPLPAAADDATWLASPASGDFNTATNWSNGTVPTATAFFGTSDVTTLNISSNVTFGALTVNAGDYNFTNAANTTLIGAGIVINGGSGTMTNNALLHFRNNSTAGSGSITNNRNVVFSDSSSAATARITNAVSGTLQFAVDSTGGNATILNAGNLYFNSGTAGSANITNTGILNFFASSNAGTASTITNNGDMWFYGGSSAATATIINGGFLQFSESSKAGNAAITNDFALYFYSASTADHATINNKNNLSFFDGSTGGDATINNEGGVFFNDNSTAGNAAIVNTAGATVSFATSTGPAGDRKLSAGSIAGAGDYILGADELTVGGNGNSTEVSGVISGTGGSLVKTGAGTLTLSGANTYTGGTTFAGGAVSVAADANLGDAAGALTFDGGTLRVTGTAFNATARTINWGAGGGGFDIADAANAFTVSQTLDGSGGLTKLGAGTLTLTGTNSYSGGTTISAGTLSVASDANLGDAAGALTFSGGTLRVTGNAFNTTARTITLGTGGGGFDIADASNTFTLSQALGGTGGLTKLGAGTLVLTATNTHTGGTKVGAGTLQLGTIDNIGSIVGAVDVGAAGKLDIFNANTHGITELTNSGLTNFRNSMSAGSANISNNAGAFLMFYGTSTGGNAAITNAAGGTVDFSNSLGSAEDNRVSAGSIAGAGNYILGDNELTVGGNNRSTEASGIISGDGGSLVKTGTGTLKLLAVNTYTGATTVDGGTLSVNGSIATSSGVIVKSGGTLGGTGQLPGVIVNTGGNLAPGNSIGTVIVNGNLAFGAGSFYTVEVSPAAADRTNVTGTATLTGATVRASALSGSFRQQTYTILNATGGLGGSSFAGLTVTGSFARARNPHLTYDANSAYLVLDPGVLALAPNATRNQGNVAGAINRTVESGGAPPAGFDALLNMSGDAAGRALDQLSGDSNTQGQTGAFQLGGSYLALLSNPFASCRGDWPTPRTTRPPCDEGAAPLGYAERTGAPSAARSAFAAIDKPAAHAPRWDLWGSTFGGGSNLSGDAAIGSASSFTRAGAVAAGADYRFAANSLLGFSLAGGATSWSAANGGGSSDVMMAGVYGRHAVGPAYVAAAASYANYWMSTTRTVTVAGLDQLKANFNAESFGGRIEAGYRLPAPFLNAGWTPYGAVQAQNFRTPDYSESASTGSDQFALRYAGRTATAVRAELGVQTERRIAFDEGSELYLFGRSAYAHDSVSDPQVSANFIALGPTGSFTAFGARTSQNLMLSSAGAEWRLASGVSFMLKADSEWGERSRTYSGAGRIRYTW